MVLDDIDVNYFVQVHEEIGTVGASDVSVSCPMCREGKSWGRKHRLHLYIKPTYDTASVHCWNCGYASNIYGYLKEFHPAEFGAYKKAKAGKGFAELKMQYDEEEKKEIPIEKIDIGFDMNSISLDEEEETPVSLEDMNSIDIGFDMSSSVIEEIKPTDGPILVEPVKNLTSLPEEAKLYIQNRGIEVQDNWLYSPINNKIRFNNADVVLSEFIIIPLELNGKWYGFQALAWKQKRFFVYLVTGNSSWKVWNWNNIDKEKPVYIFESIYDALSSGLENVIAQLGANLHVDRIKELKEPIFCLDNQYLDEASVEESMKYLELGYKCFIWPKGSEKFKDTNDLRKINVPYEKLKNMVTTNIFQGMSGVLQLKFIDN
jgi:hypothetical protein